MGILKIANLTKKKTSSITKTGTMQPEKSPSTAAPAAPVVTGSQAAYVQLNEALKEAQARSYENPYEAAALQLAQPRTDEEYARAAQAAKLPAYQAQTEALRQAKEQADMTYQNSRNDLLSRDETARRQIEADYAARQNELATAANRRGMGRSSYYLDNAANLDMAQNQALQANRAQTQAELNRLDSAQALAVEHYNQTLARLEGELAMALTEYEDALREKDKSNAQAAYKQLADHYDAYLRYKNQDTLDLIKAVSALGAKEEKAMTPDQYQYVLDQLAALAK